MSPGWRKILQRGLPVAVSVAILAWLLQGIDTDALVNALSWRVAAIIVPVMLVYGAVSLWLEATSIIRLVSTPPPGFGAWTAARIKCASYLLGILHYALGVGALSLLLRRRAGLPLSEAASLVLLISSTDLLVVLTAAGVAAASIEMGGTAVSSAVVVLAAGGFVGGLALLRSPVSLGPLDRIRSLSIFEGLRNLPLPRLLELFALRVAFSAAFVSACASAFVAFEISAPPVLIVGGVLVVALVAALPIAVAGLGTSQTAFVVLFADFAPAETLLAMSLVLSFGMLTLRALMGLVVAREFTREAIIETRRAQA